MLQKLMFLVLLVFGSNLKAQNLDSFGWTLYDTLNHSLPNNMVSDIKFDKNGTAWVTTDRMSLCRFKNGKWKVMKAPVPDSTVTGWLKDIAFLSDGRLVITGIPGKLAFYNPNSNQWHYRATPNGVQFLSIACNQQNVLLLGSPMGLYQYQNEKYTLLQDNMQDVMGITLSPNGDALVGFRKGLQRFTAKNDGSYKQASLLGNFSCYEALTKDSLIWAASFSDLQLHSYDPATGQWVGYPNLPQQIFYNFNGSWKYTIHNVGLLADKRLAITTQFGAHLAVQNDTGWATYTIPIWMRDNVSFDGIECITIAPDSSIWLGTWHHGVVVLSHANNLQYPKIKVYPKPDPSQTQNPPATKTIRIQQPNQPPMPKMNWD